MTIRVNWVGFILLAVGWGLCTELAAEEGGQGIAEVSGAPESWSADRLPELRAVHEWCGPFAMEYLATLRARQFHEAAMMHHLPDGMRLGEMAGILESSVVPWLGSSWEVTGGWPTQGGNGTYGFIYQIKVSQPGAYLFLLMEVLVLEGDTRVTIRPSTPAQWPRHKNTPSVDFTSEFALGAVE